MTTQIQQARDVFASAGITAEGNQVADNGTEIAKPDEIAAPDEIVKPVEDKAEVKPVEDEVEIKPEDPIDDTGGEAAESYTVDSLAEAIGFETSDLYEMLNVPMADGQEAIPLGQVKDKFTEMGRENGTLKTQVTELQGKLEMASSGGGAIGISNEMAQAQAYIQQLQGSIGSEEMNELKELDPVKYMLQKSEINDQISQANTYMNQLNQKQQLDNATLLDGYNKKSVELIPSWSDGEVKKKDQQIMTDYMVMRGFGLGEISQMADPRIQVVVKELIDLRAEKAAATKAVEKVRKAPRVISGSRKKPVADKINTTQKLVDRAKTTRSKKDVLSAARSVMGVGI